MDTTFQPQQPIDAQLKELFAHFPKIALALLFGSVALVVSAQIVIWI